MAPGAICGPWTDCCCPWLQFKNETNLAPTTSLKASLSVGLIPAILEAVLILQFMSSNQSLNWKRLTMFSCQFYLFLLVAASVIHPQKWHEVHLFLKAERLKVHLYFTSCELSLIDAQTAMPPQNQSESRKSSWLWESCAVPVTQSGPSDVSSKHNEPPEHRTPTHWHHLQI